MTGMWVFAAAACTLGKPPPFVPEDPYCEETPRVLGLDEESPLGFAGQQLLTHAQGTHPAVFTYSRGGQSTELTLGVAYSAGEVRFIKNNAVIPQGNDSDVSIDCPDRVEVDVTLSFTTADGAFAETWDIPLAATTSEAATVFVLMDPDALLGTYDMNVDIPTPDWEARTLWTGGAFDAYGVWGDVAGRIMGSDVCEADAETCGTWSTGVAVGFWQPVPATTL